MAANRPMPTRSVVASGLIIAGPAKAGAARCHQAAGRLAGITGVYLPGRDSHPWIDRLGWTAALLTLLGVTGHGLMRLVSSRKTH